MAIGLLGRKIGMTQVYDATGVAIPVTVLEVGPCTVLQVREPDRDGYEAVQLGFDDKPRKRATRAERGHVAVLESKRRRALLAAGITPPPKANCEPKRFIKEFRLEPGSVVKQNGHSVVRLANKLELKVGDNLTVSLFEGVPAVDVVGWTKGRGFTGVMKRWNFSGLGASHGVKRHHRAPGSLSGHATDRGNSGRMKKGKRMAGRYGNERVTIRNLAVVRVDPEHNLLVVKGAVPGPNNGYIIVRPTNKRKHVAHKYEVD
ncbi:MAG: 50S ribosomal protein L3 [Gemmatales bacterium]|nr:50S ribosomal protein L3 [Gemmatales bacterium]MDW7993707.1 50S ribosomal protein L3 [Gemmatales bacterium]